MKDFFKYMFASMAGFILAYIVIFIIMFFFIVGMISLTIHKNLRKISETEVTMSGKTILKIDFREPVVEYLEDNPFASINFLGDNVSMPMSLKSVIDNLKRAKNDEKIAGIYLNLMMIPSSFPTLQEIRNSLLDFKKSGKFIYAYSEIYTKQGYFLASVADSIFLQPKGIVLFNGFSSEMAFFRGTLDKLNLQPRLIRAGKYKSAGETFTDYKMSRDNYEQMSSLINSIYGNYIAAIASGRRLDSSQVVRIAADYLVRKAEDAVKYKLADRLLYYDQFYDKLKKLTGNEKVNFVSLARYARYDDGRKTESAKTNEKIALIYAVGSIGMDGSGGDAMDVTKVTQSLTKARDDKNIKAVVLRISSPGGSALSSDVIWREVLLTKKSKPVIVSMGNVAASGGYYIACPADWIVAEPTTITGSIGVFGLFVNMEKFWQDKLGVTFDRYKTGKFADIANPNRDMTKEEEEIIKVGIDDIYNTFKSDVAAGRKLKMDEVEKIAQGRVWTGEQAKNIHLVDQLGGVYDAIDAAKKMAKIKEYRLEIYPKPGNYFGWFFRNFRMSSIKMYLQKELLGKDFEMFQRAKQAEAMNGVYMLWPYLVSF